MKPDPERPLLLNYEQAAQLLGMSVGWLQDQVQAGRFPHVKVPKERTPGTVKDTRAVRFLRADIEAYITDCYRPAEGPRVRRRRKAS